MASLFKITIALLCIGFVCGQTVKKVKRKRPDPKAAFAKMFKEKPDQGSDQKTLRLGTTPVTAAFDNSTHQLRKENRGDMSDEQVRDVKALMASKCPDGTNVFNLTRMAISEAIRVARHLRPFLPPRENSTSASPPDAGGQEITTPDGRLNFLSVVCWNNTKEAFQQLFSQIKDMEPIRPAFNCKLMAKLSRNVSEKLVRLLPESALQMACRQLQKADTACIMSMAEIFPCEDTLTEMAQSDPSVAEAMLKKRKQRGLRRMNDTEWDNLLQSMGKALPADILEEAPPGKIKERFAALWDKAKAPVFIKKMNFSTVDENFLTGMGERVCELPISALEKIPVEKLKAVKSSMSCLKNEKDKAKKRRMAKRMLGTRTKEKCKQYAEDFGSMDERCLKMMNRTDIEALDLSTSDVETIPCDTVKEVMAKLQLGNVSTWTRETMKKNVKLLRCLRKLDANDIDALAEAFENEDMPEDVHLPRHIKRKIFKKLKERATSGGKTLDTTALNKMKGMVSEMSSEEVGQLLTPNVITSVLGTMQKKFKQMSKAALRRVFGKLSSNQLQQQLCTLDELGEDVPREKLEEMTDLATQISRADCKFRCKKEGGQCKTMFSKLNATMDSWDNVPRDLIARFRDSRAICGITLEVLTSLPPANQLIDVAGAFFRAFCMDSAKSRQFYDKVSLYRELSLQRDFTSTEMEALGENYFKHMSAEDFRALRSEDQRSIAPLLGAADLDDADPEWFQEMASAAVNAVEGSTGDISPATALSLGRLVCGLSADHINRLTQSALQDVMPILSECSDANPDRQDAILRKVKASTSVAEMDAADLSEFGFALLSDPDTMSQVSDDPMYDILEDSAKTVSTFRKKKKAKGKRFKDLNPEASSRQEAKIRKSLRYMLAARSRVRKATASGGEQPNRPRSKRSTDPPTCDDIQLVGDEASILSEQDIADLSDDNFNDCVDVLGSVTDWSDTQKTALASKAKQVWGDDVTQWSAAGVVETAGSILQGLTADELSSMNLQLEQIETVAWTPSWKPEQLEAVLNKWLQSDRVTSLTAEQVVNLGHFVCGASPDSMSALLPDETFSATLSEISDAAKDHCSPEQLKELSAVALRSKGSVTSWSLGDTADIGILLAGLPGSELAKLSDSQMTTMDIDTFTSIPKEEFPSLTASQIGILSTQVAMSITQDQMSSLTSEQRSAFESLGLVIDPRNGAATKGPAMQVESLVVMATTILIMTRG